MKKVVARFEALFKGLAFDCHACGQCVLSQTGVICPMSCPKGVSGIHLMLLGPDSAVLPPLVENLPRYGTHLNSNKHAGVMRPSERDKP